jgi:hypothetical protein
MIDPVSRAKVGMTLIWHRYCPIFPAETYMTRNMTVSVNLRPWEMDGRQLTRTCPGERHSPSAVLKEFRACRLFSFIFIRNELVCKKQSKSALALSNAVLLTCESVSSAHGCKHD